jgi:hypothetical protein
MKSHPITDMFNKYNMLGSLYLFVYKNAIADVSNVTSIDSGSLMRCRLFCKRYLIAAQSQQHTLTHTDK